MLGGNGSVRLGGRLGFEGGFGVESRLSLVRSDCGDLSLAKPRLGNEFERLAISWLAETSMSDLALVKAR